MHAEQLQAAIAVHFLLDVSFLGFAAVAGLLVGFLRCVAMFEF